MQIENLLAPHRTRCRVDAGSKKRALEAIASLIASDLPMFDANDLFRRLIAREKLGSTGIGQGIAIPHCRIENCTGSVGSLITLASPIHYDAIDAGPVDIMFALLVPEEAHDEHLQTLAALAEKFTQPHYIQSIRSAQDDHSLYQLALTG